MVRVVLRYSLLGTYYGGRFFAADTPERALNLGTIERAVQFAREERLTGMQIVVFYDDPVCELVFPLAGNRTSRVKAAPDSSPENNPLTSPSAPPKLT